MITTATPTSRMTTTRRAFPLKFVLVTFSFIWAFWLYTEFDSKHLTPNVGVALLANWFLYYGLNRLSLITDRERGGPRPLKIAVLLPTKVSVDSVY